MSFLVTVLVGLLIAALSTAHDFIGRYIEEYSNTKKYFPEPLSYKTFLRSNRWKIVLSIIAKTLVFIVIYAMGTLIWFDIIRPHFMRLCP